MSGWHGPGKQYLAGAGDWATVPAYAVVVDEADYTYSRTHATMASIPTAARQGTPVALTGKTVNAAGELDCDDFTVTGLAAGQVTAEAVEIYLEPGAATDAARIPLLYLNGLTIIPNGGNYTFQVANVSPYLGRL